MRSNFGLKLHNKPFLSGLLSQFQNLVLNVSYENDLFFHENVSAGKTHVRLAQTKGANARNDLTYMLDYTGMQMRKFTLKRAMNAAKNPTRTSC